jgi:hypothetical protein
VYCRIVKNITITLDEQTAEWARQAAAELPTREEIYDRGVFRRR